MFALVIIDQQKGIDHPKLGVRNNLNAESNMLVLLNIWREKSWPVFHVQHKSKDPSSVFWPEQEGVEFKREFVPRVNEYVIVKSIPCAFLNNRLERELNQLDVRAVVVVGVATNNSVDATARTGGNLGFQVFVVEDACFTFEKRDYFGVKRSAAEVHAMSLANLNAEYATVLSAERLIELAKNRCNSP